MKTNKPFTALLKVNFRQLLNSSVNLGSKNKKKSISGVASLIFLTAIGVLLGASYSFMLAGVFAPLGALNVMVMYMMQLTLVATILFTFFSAQTLIYSTKDIDLILSLPVSSFKIMVARIMALYLQALLIVEAMFIPVGVVYMLFNGEQGVVTLIQMIVMGIFYAIIPTLFGLVGGFLISWISSKLPFKNLINTIVSLVLVILFMYLCGNTGFNSVAGDADMLTAGMPWFIKYISGAVVGFHPLKFIVVIVGTVVPFILLCWLFSFNFKKILSGLTATRRRKDYKMQSLKTQSSFGALLGKEANRFFKTPILLVNSGFSVLLMVIVAVIAVFNKSAISSMMSALQTTKIGDMIPVIFFAVIAFFVSMIVISGSSISLEGKTLWILKEAPVTIWTIFAAKGGFNAIVDAVACLICVPLLGYALSLSVGDILLVLLLSVLYSVFASFVGLLINLLFPKMDGENDAVIVKQSSSIIISMLVDIVSAAILVGIYFLVSIFTSSFVVVALVVLVALGLLIALVFWMLNTVGMKKFSEL